MVINFRILVSTLFPLFLILSQYKYYFSINVGYILFLLLSAVGLLYRTKLAFDLGFVSFVVSIFICSFSSLFFYGAIYNGNIPYLLVGFLLTIIVLVMANNLDMNALYKPYLYLAVLATAIIVVQTLYIKVFGREVSPINILPVAKESERLWLPEPRASGFFTEPQLYASFVMPLYLISLISKRFLIAFFLLFGILASGSTYGLVIAFALLMWILVVKRQLLNTKVFASFIFMVVVVVVLAIYTSIFDSGIDKIARTDISQGIRVSKAFFIFIEMSSQDYLLGIRASVEDFVKLNISSFPWLMPYVISNSHLLGYVTGFFGLIIYYGFLPFCLFIVFLINKYRCGSMFQKGMVIMIFLHSISATILFNGYYVFFMTFLLCKHELFKSERRM